MLSDEEASHGVGGGGRGSELERVGGTSPALALRAVVCKMGMSQGLKGKVFAICPAPGLAQSPKPPARLRPLQWHPGSCRPRLREAPMVPPLLSPSHPYSLL